MQKENKFRLCLFGSPHLYKNDEELSVSRRRVRGLLYFLGAENEAISRSILTYFFWPDNDPDTANHNLSVSISYLRSVLGREHVVSTTDAISLHGVETDINEFRKLAVSTDIDELKTALNMWAPFLEGFSVQKSAPFEQWVREMDTRLTSLYTDAAINAADLCAKSGDYEEALAVLDRAAAFDPLNERFCRLRMQYLQLCGRASSVSRVYSELVSRLNRELGVPPSPETSNCYQQLISSQVIFSDNDRLQKINALRNEDMIFIGRKVFLETMLSLFKPRFFLLQGDPGIGKTRLAREFIKRTNLPHISVIFRQQDQNVPYFAIINTIRNLMHSQHWPEILQNLKRNMPEEHIEILQSIIPEFPGKEQAAAGRVVTSHYQILETLEQLLSSVFARETCLILLDDIQYADESSIEVLRHLMSLPSLRSLRFVATLRPALSSSHVMAFLNSIQRENKLYTLDVGPLDKESMSQILLYYFPDMDRESSERLISLADGNPYWLRTIMCSLDSGYTEISGKLSLEKLYRQSIKALSAEALLVLECLAIYGSSCSAQFFATLCGNSSPSQIYYELSVPGIINTVSNGYAFTHSMIYEHVLAGIKANPSRERKLHGIVAQAIEESESDALSGSDFIALADHYKASLNHEKGAEYAVKAGAYLISITSRAQANEYLKYAISYQNLPSRFDTVFLLHDSLMQAGSSFEANISLNNATGSARTGEFEEYYYCFSALSKLTTIPEYAEVHAGIVPCYSRILDSEIETQLFKALDAIDNGHPNTFLKNHILLFLSEYYRICGNNASAKSFLYHIINLNIPDLNKSDIPTKRVVLTALRDLISMLNQESNVSVYDVIAVESRIFSVSNIKSFTGCDIGIRALRENFRGNYSEGEKYLKQAISEYKACNNTFQTMDGLVTYAITIRKKSISKSYSLNYEAYSIAKQLNAPYTLFKTLSGLALTSSNQNDALKFYTALTELGNRLDSPSAIERIINVGLRLRDRGWIE